MLLQAFIAGGESGENIIRVGFPAQPRDDCERLKNRLDADRQHKDDGKLRSQVADDGGYVVQIHVNLTPDGFVA